MKSQKIVITLVLVFIVFSVFTSSLGSVMYTIESGTVGVLVKFGKYSEDVRQAGLHFKIPFIQNVKVLDIKLQTANYLATRGAATGDSQDTVGVTTEGVINNPQIRVLDSKSLSIGIELSVQFTPIAEKANVILEKYGENYFDKVINPLVRNIVRDVVGKYQAEDIAVKRSEISTEIQTQLEKKFDELEHKPFALNNVGLRNIHLPEIIIKKIEEVQLAKQEEQRLAMVEQQAKKNQEIKRIEADTRLIEVTTQAKADAEKQRIEADAEAYRIAAEAKAHAEANKLVAQSLTRELISYRSIEQWDGKYPLTLIGSNGQGGLILSLPNTTASPTESVAPKQ